MTTTLPLVTFANATLKKCSFDRANSQNPRTHTNEQSQIQKQRKAHKHTNEQWINHILKASHGHLHRQVNDSHADRHKTTNRRTDRQTGKQTADKQSKIAKLPWSSSLAGTDHQPSLLSPWPLRFLSGKQLQNPKQSSPNSPTITIGRIVP